jgi:hypothetical protein
MAPNPVMSGKSDRSTQMARNVMPSEKNSCVERLFFLPLMCFYMCLLNENANYIRL